MKGDPYTGPLVKPCHDCAFTEGTEASKAEHTRILADLCVEGNVPFHCHTRNSLCAGSQKAQHDRLMSGGYRNEAKTALAAALADVVSRRIQQAVDGEEVTDEQFARDVLEALS